MAAVTLENNATFKWHWLHCWTLELFQFQTSPVTQRLPLFPPEGFPCKTSPGFRNGWTTWSGRSGPRVDISTCAASISQGTASMFDGASATWRTQPSRPCFLPLRMYVSVLFTWQLPVTCVAFSASTRASKWRSALSLAENTKTI